LTARRALALATIGGARCLGRADEIGSLEPGKLADLALWRLDGLGHAGIADPVTALVLGSAPPLELLTVGGSVVVERDELRTADEAAVTADLRRACVRLREAP
jgi:cytosine/adenosine deaminase-related metal-dependent hydrolase